MNTPQQIVRKSRSVVEELLSKLTTEQRAAVTLHYRGLTYESVASLLGCPRWKVKKWIYQSLCIMRKTAGVLPEQSTEVEFSRNLFKEGSNDGA